MKIVKLIAAITLATGITACNEEIEKVEKIQPSEVSEMKTSQTDCPVMVGNKINKSLFADVKGKRIYVCCQGCIAPIKATPEKFIKQFTDKGITLPNVQTKCPVMGSGVTDQSKFVDVKGKRIYVCCPPCVDKIKADPDKYIKQLESKGIALDIPSS